MGESSAFVSILVSSFSQNPPLQLGNDRGFLQDICCIIFKCVWDVVSRPQKKRCDLLFRPQEKRSRNSPFDWKPCGPWSSLGHLSILLPCLLMLLIVLLLLYLLSGFSYCSCSTLVIILLMMMSWIWLDGDHSLHFHFVTNSHVERLVAHSRLFDSKWELFLNSILWLLDARKIHWV